MCKIAARPCHLTQQNELKQESTFSLWTILNSRGNPAPLEIKREIPFLLQKNQNLAFYYSESLFKSTGVSITLWSSHKQEKEIQLYTSLYRDTALYVLVSVLQGRGGFAPGCYSGTFLQRYVASTDCWLSLFFCFVSLFQWEWCLTWKSVLKRSSFIVFNASYGQALNITFSNWDVWY